MDRRLRSTPRAAAAMSIFLLLGGLGGLAAGLVAADSSAPTPGGPPPADAGTSELALPMPRVGDHGRYTVAIDHEASPRTVGPAAWTVEFLWLDDEQVVGPDGSRIWANHLYVNETRDGISSVRDLLFPAGQTMPYAARFGSSDAASSSARSMFGTVSDSSTSNQTTLEYPDARGSEIPCGLRNPFQGNAWGLDATVPDPFACIGIPNQPHTTDVQFRDGKVVDGSVRFAWWMRLGFDDGSKAEAAKQADVDFRPSLAYPVRLSDGILVHTLTAFAQGTGPVLRADGGAEPTPRLAFAPLDADGPDETGVAHPFPLSAAFRAVRDDPADLSFLTYLATHPDAVMVWARHMAYDSEGVGPAPPHITLERWSFGLSDGRDSYEAAWEQSTYGVSGAPGAPAGRRVDPDHPFDGLKPLALQDLPASIPTVASMLAQWQAYAPEGATGNDWGFVLMAQEDGQPLLEAWAGSQHMDVKLDATLQYQDQDYRWSLMGWRPDGSVRFATEIAQTGSRRAGPMSEIPPPKAAAAIPVLVASAWIVPDAGAATTVSLGAGLVSALYFFWPAMKAGFFGLFSTTRDDALLDNPIRRRIHAAIEARPGIHYQALLRAVKEPNGTVEHHLGKLVAAGLVKRARGTGYTCYFPQDAAADAMAAAPALRADVAQRLLGLLQRRPGITIQEAARILGVSGGTVHYHLERLRRSGLVSAGTTAPTAAGAAA